MAKQDSLLYLFIIADILDRVSPKFEELDLDYECLGGGRIQHSSEQKTIQVYGYSVVSYTVVHCET